MHNSAVEMMFKVRDLQRKRHYCHVEVDKRISRVKLEVLVTLPDNAVSDINNSASDVDNSLSDADNSVILQLDALCCFAAVAQIAVPQFPSLL